MNLKFLFNPSFLFNINTVIIERADNLFFLIGAIMLVLGVLLKLAAVMAPNPVDLKYRQKFFYLFASIGVSEIIWYGARLQTVRFFGTHFVALVVLLIGLIWFVVLDIKTFLHYDKEKKVWEKQQIKLKYLVK